VELTVVLIAGDGQADGRSLSSLHTTEAAVVVLIGTAAAAAGRRIQVGKARSWVWGICLLRAAVPDSKKQAAVTAMVQVPAAAAVKTPKGCSTLGPCRLACNVCSSSGLRSSCSVSGSGGGHARYGSSSYSKSIHHPAAAAAVAAPVKAAASKRSYSIAC